MRYGEGISVGYRGLQRLGSRLSYPFGYGPAYTTFEFSGLRVEAAEVTPETTLGEVILAVSFTVTNTGGRSGVVISQLYIGYPVPSVGHPPRELRGLRHLELGPEESIHVEIQVTHRDLSFWDAKTYSWGMEPRRTRVEIGASARDVKLGPEMDLPAPPQHLPLTEWSIVVEWRRYPMAWKKLKPFLASFGKESRFFLLDLPVRRPPLVFEDTLTFDQLAELPTEIRTTPSVP